MRSYVPAALALLAIAGHARSVSVAYGAMSSNTPSDTSAMAAPGNGVDDSGAMQLPVLSMESAYKFRRHEEFTESVELVARGGRLSPPNAPQHPPPPYEDEALPPYSGIQPAEPSGSDGHRGSLDGQRAQVTPSDLRARLPRFREMLKFRLMAGDAAKHAQQAQFHRGAATELAAQIENAGPHGADDLLAQWTHHANAYKFHSQEAQRMKAEVEAYLAKEDSRSGHPGTAP
ncbi:hypothetical protein BC835DRAFT_1411401 [Cytidiella melzeri]|nr:hypothetical protein BC835DRAFT_1411401 [Cytidiella melzeri]